MHSALVSSVPAQRTVAGNESAPDTVDQLLSVVGEATTLPPRGTPVAAGQFHRQANVTVATIDSLWDALARARDEYDPQVLDDAESAVAATYWPVTQRIVQRLTVNAVLLRAAERGLHKAVRCWPRPHQPWGFDEFARQAIEAEIRTCQESEN